MLLALLACHPPPQEPHPPAADPLDELVLGGCGLEPYEPVPLDRMGEIVDHEYLAGASVPLGALEAVLASQGIDATGLVEHGIRTWRIRYLTQDRGELIEATGLLAVPDDVEADVALPTVVWPHPTTGFSDDCAPSGDDVELALGNVLLAAAGFVVVAPDYLGMAGWGPPSELRHPYLVPEPTAFATLDALRALQRIQAGETDLRIPGNDGRTVLWGASQGGNAALWADLYAPYYLPGQDFTAVVAAVPPTDLTGMATYAATFPVDATGGLLGVLSMHREWYRSDAVLTEVVTDQDPLWLASNIDAILDGGCADEPPVELTGKEEFEDLYTPAFLDMARAGDWDAMPPWGCYFEQASLLESPLERRSDAPVMMVVGERDTLVVGEIERANVPNLCDAGYDVHYVECDEADHVQAAADSLGLQLQWVRDRLDGVPQGETCVVGPPQTCSFL